MQPLKFIPPWKHNLNFMSKFVLSHLDNSIWWILGNNAGCQEKTWTAITYTLVQNSELFQSQPSQQRKFPVKLLLSFDNHNVCVQNIYDKTEFQKPFRRRCLLNLYKVCRCICDPFYFLHTKSFQVKKKFFPSECQIKLGFLLFREYGKKQQKWIPQDLLGLWSL